MDDYRADINSLMDDYSNSPEFQDGLKPAVVPIQNARPSPPPVGYWKSLTASQKSGFIAGMVMLGVFVVAVVVVVVLLYPKKSSSVSSPSPTPTPTPIPSVTPLKTYQIRAVNNTVCIAFDQEASAVPQLIIGSCSLINIAGTWSYDELNKVLINNVTSSSLEACVQFPTLSGNTPILGFNPSISITNCKGVYFEPYPAISGQFYIVQQQDGEEKTYFGNYLQPGISWVSSISNALVFSIS